MIKLNSGKNLIFGSDITLEGSNIGKTVDDVLEEQETRIKKLESNTKWLYKYGGMGSGGGGTGTSTESNKWKVVLTCQSQDGKVLKDGDKIDFGGVGQYTFRVRLYNVGEMQFTINWQYKSKKNGGTVSKTNILPIGTTEIDQSFLFDTNSSLNIIISDNNGGNPVTYSIDYIVIPYEFNAYYMDAVKNTEITTDSGYNMYMSQVKTNGVKLVMEYSVNTALKTASYTYVNWDGTKVKIETKTKTENEKEVVYGIKTLYAEDGGQTEIEITDTGMLIPLTSGSGKITMSLLDDETDEAAISYLSNNANAGYKSATIDFGIILANGDGKTEESIPQIELFRHLIPSNLFLKVTTDAGSIYKGDSAPSIFNKNFNIGDTVFYVVPSNNGRDNTRVYILNIYYYYIDEDGIEQQQTLSQQLTDMTESTIAITLQNFSENAMVQRIKFELSLNSQIYSATYYFKVNPLNNIFSWYPKLSKLGSDDKGNPYIDVKPEYAAYFYPPQKAVNINNLTVNSTIKKTINDDTTTYSFNTDDIDYANIVNYDTMISFGIQYSLLNDTDNPIMSFITTSEYNNKGIGSIYVYQNKIVITTQSSTTGSNDTSIEIFIDKTSNLSISDTSSYHLVTIYKRLQAVENNNTFYRSIEVYIDGVLEGTTPVFEQQTKVFESVRFYNQNYYVNLIEYSLFEHNAEPSDINKRTYLTECDITGYYYAYITKILNIDVTSQTQEVYELFSRCEKLDNGFIKCTESIIKNIATKTSIPIMIMKFNDTDGKRVPDQQDNPIGTDNFLEWIKNTAYTQEQEIGKVQVAIEWSDGSGSGISPIKYNGTQAMFQTTIQGSSTRSYYCKNFELYSPVAEDGYTYYYSPNYDPADSSTFLPEESFTLKADVIDSSHSNNTVMGRFINDVATKFAGAKQSGSKYGDYIKNCLLGFPILLFLNTNYNSQENITSLDVQNFYFLGIYNFNLGRNSYFNLGYKDLSLLDDMSLQSGFHIYKLETSTAETAGLLRNVQAAEVQDNNTYWDFSQYDSTVLFGRADVDGDAVMFGDLVDGSNSNYQTLKATLPEAIKQVAMAGGYVFDTLNKTMSTTSSDNYGYDNGYKIANQVPNYRYQLKIGTDANGKTETFTPISESAKEDDLRNSIIAYQLDDENSTQMLPAIDYTSLIEYYTFCMAFGLVDSVQKNMNLKSWNSGKTYYLAFYDMDTCLGINNNAESINYYAFSDYWLANTTDDDIPKLNKAIIYRDFTPTEGVDAGSLFDTPSSYLFAIAKYAKSILADASELAYNPNDLWLKWRKTRSSNSTDKVTGCLENAQSFIDRYYKDYLNDVPICAFNYNYIYKYLRKAENTSQPQFVSTDQSKFHGRRIARTKNWLNNRLHILDAYFNLQQSIDTIKNESGNVITYPKPTVDISDTKFTNNEDIYVIHDAFQQSTTTNRYANLNIDLQFQAIPASPIAIKDSKGTTTSYLTLDDYEKQILHLTTDGYQSYKIGGSAAWTYIQTINPFIQSKTLYIKSDYFEELEGDGNLNGTDIECASWTLNTPALRKISLTGSKFSGALTFRANTSNTTETNFYNLQYIDISNTALQLTLDNLSLQTLKAENMNGGEINATNINSLTNVSIYGTLDKLTIPGWTSEIKTLYLPTNYSSNTTSYLNCPTVIVNNNVNIHPGYNLIIRNNNSLETLTITGIETLDIQNCPKLKKITITDNNVLKNIKVVFASGVNTAFCINEDLDTENLVVDLGDQAALETIYFNYCTFDKLIVDKGYIRATDEQVKDSSLEFYVKTSENGHDFSVATTDDINNKNDLYIKQESKDITLNSQALCGSSLQYIDTFNDTRLILNGLGIFRNCQNYNMYRSDGIRTNIAPAQNLTDITYMFGLDSGYAGTKFNLEDLEYFINTICSSIKNKINNIKGFVCRQHNIKYTTEQVIEDLNTDKKCRIQLDFPNCGMYDTKSIQDIFFGTGVCALNRYMFKGLGSKRTFNAGLEIASTFNIGSDVNLYVTTDFLHELIEKLQKISFQYNAYGSQNPTLNFIEYTGEYDYKTDKVKYTGYKLLKTVRFEDVFHNIMRYGDGEYDKYLEASETDNGDKYYISKYRLKTYRDASGAYGCKQFVVDTYKIATGSEDDIIYYLSNGTYTIATDEQKSAGENLYIAKYYKTADSSDTGKIRLIPDEYKKITAADSDILEDNNIIKYIYSNEIQYVKSSNATTYSTLNNTVPFMTPRLLCYIYGFEVQPIYIDENGETQQIEYDMINVFSTEFAKNAKTNQISIQGFISNNCYGKTKQYNIKIKKNSLNNIFYNIKPYEIYRVFGFIDYETDDENGLNIYTLFNWESGLTNAINLFQIQYGSIDFISFNVDKYVSIENFHKIWDNLIKNTGNLKKIAYLFKDAKIITNESIGGKEYDFYLQTNKNSADQNNVIISIPRIFEYMKVCAQNGEPLYLNLSHNFLHCMPKLIDVHQAFSNICLSHTLPFDFFNKRVENTEKVLLKINDEFVDGVYHSFTYAGELTNVVSCFCDISCLNDLDGFDPHAEYNNDYNGNSTFKDNYLAKIDEDGTETPVDLTSYYSTTDKTIEKYITHANEITDCDISTDYTQNITITYTEDSNAKEINPSNYTLDKYNDAYRNKVFVAPDIFYGLNTKTSMTLNSVFANSNNSATFTGAIPKNMFCKYPSIQFKNMFQNLNILPYKFDELTIDGESNEYYTFVPENFTTQTNLESSFNFKILLPEQADHINATKNYCILTDSSIPENVTTLKNSLPTTCPDTLLLADINNSNSAFEYQKIARTGQTYSIMLTKNSNGTNYTSGIDISSKFTKLKLDNLITGKLVTLLTGRIFTTDMSTSLNNQSRVTSGCYVINTSQWNLFSAALQEYFPATNNRFIIKYTSGNVSINKNSIMNYSSIESTFKTQYNLTVETNLYK